MITKPVLFLEAPAGSSGLCSLPSTGGLNHTWSSSLAPPKEGSRTAKGKLSGMFRECMHEKGGVSNRLEEVQGRGEEGSHGKGRRRGAVELDGR